MTSNYGDTLYGVVLRIVRQKEVADEVIQDVFVKIWQQADKYNPARGRLFTWMVNIARNTAIDVTRSARHRRESKTGELDNTIIIITSDNGMPFPRAKANLYDFGTRMPLAIYWKGTIESSLPQFIYQFSQRNYRILDGVKNISLHNDPFKLLVVIQVQSSS